MMNMVSKRSRYDHKGKVCPYCKKAFQNRMTMQAHIDLEHDQKDKFENNW
jgi:hypothetical protein